MIPDCTCGHDLYRHIDEDGACMRCPCREYVSRDGASHAAQEQHQMTAPDHYREAERLADRRSLPRQGGVFADDMERIAQAQLHATLALVGLLEKAVTPTYVFNTVSETDGAS